MPKQFVLIMTDTQRLDMVSCYEDVGVKTPCIDALAKDGVKFTKAYTTQPACGRAACDPASTGAPPTATPPPSM